MTILGGLFAVLFCRFLLGWWAAAAALLAISAYILLVSAGGWVHIRTDGEKKC